MCKTSEKGRALRHQGIAKLSHRASTAVARFFHSEDGNMSIFAVFGSLSLIAIGGVGIDMMHAEMKRTKLQNTLDRAVLAAADLDQTLDAESVVRDYFDKSRMPDALTFVDPDEGLNYRRVTAKAEEALDANFTKILGIDRFNAKATAVAQEHIQNVEISLVLDISGSMADPASGTTDDKIDLLQDAADTFIETVLGEDNEGLVSVSLVPYSEHVNAGPDIANQLNVDWRHGYSHCLEFPDSAFTSAALDTNTTYEQMQHFQWNYFGSNEVVDTICPQYSYERIQAFSNDETSLKNQIDKLEPRAGTSIFLGMKWGTALLDPSTRGIATNINSGAADDSPLKGRPFDYGREDVLKTIVLMTDGKHDKSYRLSNWVYDHRDEVAHWARYNLWYYLNRNVHSYNRSSFYYQKYNAELGDRLLDDICDAAKAKDIVIWAVGFEVEDHGRSVMQNCASSPSHYFDVDGVEIEDAFRSIARSINQLRLTQ